MKTVLLVDAKAEERRELAEAFAQAGYRVLEAGNGRSALTLARRERLQAVVLDPALPDMDGLSAVKTLHEIAPGRPLVVVTGMAAVAPAIEIMRSGADDLLTKPLELAQVIARTARAIDAAHATGAVPAPASRLGEEMEALGILGRSRGMLTLFETVKRVAPYAAMILLLGESGTGKELVARALHVLGPRRGGPFVPINCANLSEAILESELFGHERGAFTSAESAKVGVMEGADKGTLFLDEVNELGLGAQAKLLRVLERREFRRVGGTRKIQADFNVVAASNADLDGWVRAGRFRPDLYYRLNVVSLEIPPLRARQDAIVPLAERFLAEGGRHIGRPARRLSSEVVPLLERYPWPGNVRELKNLMQSLTFMAPGPVIEIDDLPPAVRGTTDEDIHLRVGMSMEDVEREVIRRNLNAYPTIKETAVALGIGLRTLHEKMRRYGLRRSRA